MKTSSNKDLNPLSVQRSETWKWEMQWTRNVYTFPEVNISGAYLHACIFFMILHKKSPFFIEYEQKQ